VSYGGANVWSDQTKVGGSKHSYLQLDLDYGTITPRCARRSQLQSEIDRLLCNEPNEKPQDWDHVYAAPPSPPPLPPKPPQPCENRTQKFGPVRIGHKSLAL
jgi:hypothetical protein